MPTYVYRCADCGEEFEYVQNFEDSALTRCQSCGGTLKRLLFPPAVIFKGSGWYCTDNRSSFRGNGGSSKKAEEDQPEKKKAEEQKVKEPAVSESTSGEDKEA